MNDVIALLTQKPDLANAIAAIASAAVALLAFVISVVSVYVSHATLKHQRQHNVLSVRPIPMVSVADYENRLTVKLCNNGTGPLIVTGLSVRNGSVSKEALIYWMPPLPDGQDWATYVGPVTKRSIPATGEITLIELAGDEKDKLFATGRDAVRTALGPLTVVIQFTDVYGSRFEAHEKSLRWFSRSILDSELKLKSLQVA